MGNVQLSTLGTVIKTAYEAELDTNAFTDAEKSKLSNAARLDTAQTYSKQQNASEAALSDGASIAWNLDDAQAAKVTLAGNRTLDDPTNMVTGGTYVLRVTQDATGSRTLSYGSAYKWEGGTAPTLSTAANAVDILTFTSDGTSMFGVIAKDFG
jgi:hypothetical protein